MKRKVNFLMYLLLRHSLEWLRADPPAAAGAKNGPRDPSAGLR